MARASQSRAHEPSSAVSAAGEPAPLGRVNSGALAGSGCQGRVAGGVAAAAGAQGGGGDVGHTALLLRLLSEGRRREPASSHPAHAESTQAPHWKEAAAAALSASRSERVESGIAASCSAARSMIAGVDGVTVTEILTCETEPSCTRRDADERQASERRRRACSMARLSPISPSEMPSSRLARLYGIAAMLDESAVPSSRKVRDNVAGGDVPVAGGSWERAAVRVGRESHQLWSSHHTCRA